MIASMHIADVGKPAALRLIRRGFDPAEVPGARYAALTTAAPLGGGLLPRPSFGRVGLIAAWEDDRALEDFLAGHPVAEHLANGWSARLEPKRIVGVWPGVPLDLDGEEPMADDEPCAALTLGRLRLTQTVRFLRASAAAEHLATTNPALLASTGLAKPPALVATFSLWRSTAAMSAYSLGRAGREHLAAVKAHGAKPFHHESAFVRFRPYAVQGLWDGRNPLEFAQQEEIGSPQAIG